jgi:flagellar biosynthetic protein FliR
MSTGLTHLLPHIPAFLLVMSRLTGIFMFGPVFGASVIPRRVKVLLALVLAFCIYPIIPPQVPVQLTMGNLIFAVAGELLIGAVIGYVASLPLVGMQLAGVMIGHQLGLGLAQVFNPEFDEQTEVFSQFMFLAALAAFLIMDGHHAMIHALVGSFETIQLGGYVPDGRIVTVVTGLLTSAFELAIKVSAPLLAVIFLETLAMGFVARTVPQLNILSLGFPLRLILGFGITAGLVTLMFDEMMAAMLEMFRAMVRMFAM